MFRAFLDVCRRYCGGCVKALPPGLKRWLRKSPGTFLESCFGLLRKLRYGFAGFGAVAAPRRNSSFGFYGGFAPYYLEKR